MENGIDAIEVGEEIHLSQSAYTPAPLRGQVVIHADADEIYSDDASKTEFVPILSEAMKEIIDVSQPGECKSPTKESENNTATDPEDHSQFTSYVTVAVSPGGQITSAEKENTPPIEHPIHAIASDTNENQNNSSYQRIVVQGDADSCQPNDCHIVTHHVEFSKATCDGNAITVTPSEEQKSETPVSVVTMTPISTADAIGHGVNIEAPILNGYQKPKMNIVQQIVQAFKASHKKEMHPSEVYEQVQMIFPYYRQLNKKKKKSWMSSVRHALTSSRFKGRRVHDEIPKSVIRKGSLWSLNENFNPDGSVGVRKRNVSHRKGSSRRKQKLAGRTRQDLEDFEQCRKNSPQRAVPPPVYHPPAAAAAAAAPPPQMSHMQSAFAPGAMVFPPSYPVMGYMHNQSPALCQQPLPGQQQWITMQPCKPGDADQCIPQNVHMAPHQMQQLTSGMPPNRPDHHTVNVVHHSGQHFQMPPQGPDGRQIIYQSMNMVSNDSHLQSSQQTTPHSQHLNQHMISQQDGYQTKANHYQTTNQAQHNTSDLHSKFSHPIVHNSQPAMVTTLQPQNCGQPLGSGWQKPSSGYTHFPNNQLGYGNPHLGADTSMNWNYAQPGSQLMQTVGHQQFSIHCSPGRSKKDIGASVSSSEPAVPTSIYATLHVNPQSQPISTDAGRSPPPHAYGNEISSSCPPVSHQGVHLITASGQYMTEYEHSSAVQSGTHASDVKSEISE